jgi:DNA polymerase-3 subunit delta
MITLLTGPNSYAISMSIQDKKKVFEGEAETFDAAELEPKHLPDLFRGASLFAANRLIIIRSPASNKTLWTELEQWIEQTPDETDIVLIESSPDKRTKTYKQLQKHGTVREHKELADHELAQWLQSHARASGTDLSSDVTKYFISYVGRDQWRLVNEFDKLLLAERPLSKELIQDIVEPYPEATAFELLDSVFKKDEKRVDELITILSVREDPYQFFGLLSSQVFALLALVSAGSKRPADIASDMGLHPFVVSKLVSVSKQLGRPRVNVLVDKLAQCDIRIKTSGVDPWHQLRITLLSLCHMK